MSKAIKVSTVEELLNYEKFKPIDNAKDSKPTKTQTMSKLIGTGNKSTARDLYERSCVDVVLEYADKSGFLPAVYIRPLNEHINDLLAKTHATNRKSFEKEMECAELKEKFIEMMPNYKKELVFRETIFWYSYDNLFYNELIKTAKKII